MPRPPLIQAYAVRTPAGITLKLEQAAAERYAADFRGTVHRLIEHHPIVTELAADYIRSDIEGNSTPWVDHVGVAPLTWWDTRPMLDPREQPDHVIDMATQALAYADACGLITRHPSMPHMVRITSTSSTRG
ncbi:MAG: hypothetical protein AB9M53_00545 [Leptothrix sp. (in: b-proteobacteria)]